MKVWSSVVNWAIFITRILHFSNLSWKKFNCRVQVSIQEDLEVLTMKVIDTVYKKGLSQIWKYKIMLMLMLISIFLIVQVDLDKIIEISFLFLRYTTETTN